MEGFSVRGAQMRAVNHIRKVSFLVTLALAASCGESTEPKPTYSGTYALVRLDAFVAPPYTINGPSLGGTTIVTADTVVVQASGSYEHRIKSPDFTSPLRFGGSYVRSGDTLVFTSTQDDAFRSAHFEADTLRISAGEVSGPRWSLGYVRAR